MAKGYRTNVGAVLMRADGRVLVAERINQPGSWQFPQGGVDKGEGLEEAMWRELGEELGLKQPRSVCRVLGHGPEVRYDFPKGMKAKIAKKYAGQAQTLFVLGFDGQDSDFDLNADKHPEFQALRWVTPRQAVDLYWEVKRPIVEATFEALKAHINMGLEDHEEP